MVKKGDNFQILASTLSWFLVIRGKPGSGLPTCIFTTDKKISVPD